MIFHIIGIPHTIARPELPWSRCGFTQKTRWLAQMLTNNGHDVYHYGCEGADIVCTEHIAVTKEAELKTACPQQWDVTKPTTFNVQDSYHQRFFNRTARELANRLDYGDFLLCPFGRGQQPIIARLNDRGSSVPFYFLVESGIGYGPPTFAPYRIFESYAHLHYIAGMQQEQDGKWLCDAVIPNTYEPSNFEYSEDKEDYLLFLGRLIDRKGIGVAIDIAQRTGHKLVVGGNGKYDLSAKCVEFVGQFGVEERKTLLSKAKALLCPTHYYEPFGNVAIEAMVSGTPVISTDQGAFTETILHGITGYRCRSMDQFTWAVNNVDAIKSINCYNWVTNNFSMEKVGKMYEEYFSTVYTKMDKGFYQENEGRTELDWMTKTFPVNKYE